MDKSVKTKEEIFAELDAVLEKLKVHSHYSKTKKNYDILHELCRAEYENGECDYSFSNLGAEWKRLSGSKMMSWETYSALPRAWAKVTDGILLDHQPPEKYTYKPMSTAGKADYSELDRIIASEKKSRTKQTRERIDLLHQICKEHHERGGLNFSYLLLGDEFNKRTGKVLSASSHGRWKLNHYGWIPLEWAHATGGTTESPDSVAIELEKREVINYISTFFEDYGLLPTYKEIRENSLTLRVKRYSHASNNKQATFIRYCFVLWGEEYLNNLTESDRDIFSVCDSLYKQSDRIPSAEEVMSAISTKKSVVVETNDLDKVIEKWSRFQFSISVNSYYSKQQGVDNFSWMALHKDLALWRPTVIAYMDQIVGPSVVHSGRYAIYGFMVDYLLKKKIPASPSQFFSLPSQDVPSFYDVCLSGLEKSAAIRRYRALVKFIEFTLTNCEGLFVIDENGYRIPDSQYHNPLPGLPDEIAWIRSTAALARGEFQDPEISYLTKRHPDMEKWRQYGIAFLGSRKGNLNGARRAIRLFLNDYILGNKLVVDPDKLLSTEWRENNLLPSYCDTSLTHVDGKMPSQEDIRITEQFLDYVLIEYYSAENDFGRRIVSGDYSNPLYTQRNSENSRFKKNPRSKSNKEVLPSRFIRYCKDILYPVGSMTFTDLKWAQAETESSWFEVPYSLIDKTDPDCVWRTRTIRRDSRWEQYKDVKSELITIYDMWSPAITVAMIIKLELPLRQYQIRLLDSGESDTWRYCGSVVSYTENGEWKYQAGGWVKNSGPLAQGDAKKPRGIGVFRRMPSSDVSKMLTGLYINTNKTADRNKDQFDRGYEVPWQHATVLYWLERLRNWQEKYNPIEGPVSCQDMPQTVIGDKTPEQRMRMGSLCCLFRDAAHRDQTRRKMPIVNSQMGGLWKKILMKLEDVCEEKGHTTSDGSRLIFMTPEARANTNATAVLYPLHSLRVSLITLYSTEGGVDPSVLSECIAGHASVIMTLYYKKSGITYVSEQMDLATKRIDEGEADNLLRWSRDATLRQLEVNTAYVDVSVLQAVKKAHKDGGSALIRTNLGLCAKGGEGCDSGGIWLDDETGAVSYREVPGYPAHKNCVRCRWFLTGPAFLLPLVHHWNSLHWHLNDTGHRYLDLSSQMIELEQQLFECQQNGVQFKNKAKMDELQHILDAAYNGNEKLAEDSLSTLRLIARCKKIVDDAKNHDSEVVLVAVGGMEDVQINIRECNELEQILTASAGALIYADPDVSKAVIKAGAAFDRMFDMNGKEPVFFKLDDRELPVMVSHMIALLQAQAGSISRAVPYIEGVGRLADIGLGGETTQEILQLASAGIQLRVAGTDSKGPLLIDTSDSHKNIPLNLVKDVTK